MRILTWIVGGMLLLLGGVSPAQSDGTDLEAYHRARLAEVRAEIAARGQHWTADLTSIAAYTPEEFEAMLGDRMPDDYARRLGQIPRRPFPSGAICPPISIGMISGA